MGTLIRMLGFRTMRRWWWITIFCRSELRECPDQKNVGMGERERGTSSGIAVNTSLYADARASLPVSLPEDVPRPRFSGYRVSPFVA